jgi:hypothetical protein
MKFEIKLGQNPELSHSFPEKTYLGRIRVEDYPARLTEVLRSVPPPHCQRAFNPETMRTEQIKPDRTSYGPNEQRPQYIKCTEWTEQRALPALYQHQLLHNNLQQAPLEQAIWQESSSRTSQAANTPVGTGSSGWI